LYNRQHIFVFATIVVIAGKAEMIPAGVQRVQLLSLYRMRNAAFKLAHERQKIPDIG